MNSAGGSLVQISNETISTVCIAQSGIFTSGSGSRVKATADDHAQMIQYEMIFGGNQTVSNLYMSMRPAGFPSQYETDNLNTYRMPLPAPNSRTTHSPFITVNICSTCLARQRPKTSPSSGAVTKSPSAPKRC